MDCREEQHLARWVEEAEHLAGSRTQKKHPVVANNRESDPWLIPQESVLANRRIIKLK